MFSKFSENLLYKICKWYIFISLKAKTETTSFFIWIWKSIQNSCKEIFYSGDRFVLNFYCEQIVIYLFQKWNKKWGSKIRHVEN